MTEEWHHVTESLPKVGQRIRAHVIKELIYQGEDQGEHKWTYDGHGEHRIYSWCARTEIKNVATREDFRLGRDVSRD